jgi:hypothetical protein
MTNITLIAACLGLLAMTNITLIAACLGLLVLGLAIVKAWAQLSFLVVAWMDDNMPPPDL